MGNHLKKQAFGKNYSDKIGYFRLQDIIIDKFDLIIETK